MIRWEDFLAEVQARKAERWAQILNAEPPGRAPGRRPRDPEKERLLTELDRARLARGIPGVVFRWPETTRGR